MEATSETSISTVTEQDLIELHRSYPLGPTFQLEVPGEEDRACRPPSGRICLYEECFKAGLRLPIHSFIVTLLLHLGLAPGALMPNSWRYICGFFAACMLAGVDPSTKLFQYLFSMKRLVGAGAHAWWYISWKAKKGMKPLIQGTPTSIHGWKTHFFFVSRTDGTDFGFPSWGTLREAATCDLQMDQELHAAVAALNASPTLQLKNLLSEEMLFNTGLSTTKPQEVETNDAPKPSRKAGRKRKAGETGTPSAQISSSPTKALALADSASAQADECDAPPLAQMAALRGPSSKRQRSRGNRGRRALIAPPSSSSGSDNNARTLPEAETLALPGIPVEVPVRATLTAAVSAEAPPPASMPRGNVKNNKRGGSTPAEGSGVAGFGLSLESSALHDRQLAQELFGNLLLPADANEVLDRSLKDLRSDTLENFFRMAHQFNWLFERSKDLKKEMGHWRAKAETLVVSRDKARQDALEAAQRADDFQQEISKGEEAYKSSRAANAKLHRNVEVLTATNAELEVIRAAHEDRIAELQSSLEALRMDQAGKAMELEDVKAAAQRREQVSASELEAALKKANDAEVRAETAVAEFRSSEAFEKEKLDFSIAAFESGIKLTQEKAVAKYPDLDWSFLFDDEESEDDDDAATPDFGNTDPPAEH